MSEPKKETVRIVLPPRREGQPLASTPRESAMINLPPKPVAAPPSAPAVPPPSLPSAPASLQPPSAPGIPKPPSFPGAPKPPGPPSAPLAPKPLSTPAGAASGVPRPASVGPTPVAVKPQPKKETAKVASSPGIAPKPQATVRLQPRPVPTQTSSAAFKVPSTEPSAVAVITEEEIPMNLALAALATAVIALLVQVWFMIS